MLGLTSVSQAAVQAAANELSQVEKDANVIIEYVKNCVPGLISFGINLLISLVIWFVGIKIIRLLRTLLCRSLERTEAEKGVIQFLDSLAKYVLYVILFMVIVGRFGVEASSIIAILGSAGLAIGLALQGSLSNLAGGVILLVVKPFRVGDYIIAQEEGTVKEIQLFYTKLLTIDNKQIMIPNGTLANGNITNVTAQDKRLLEIQVGISYNSDLKKAKDILFELMDDHPHKLEGDTLVFVDSLGDSAVMIKGRIWVPTEEYWNVRWEVTEKIKLLYDENHIEIPFKQVDVHITQAE